MMIEALKVVGLAIGAVLFLISAVVVTKLKEDADFEEMEEWANRITGNANKKEEKE